MTAAPDAGSWATGLVPGFDLRIWDGEAVVYVLATGSTHELDPGASAVLEVLHAHPGAVMSEAQLLEALDDEADAGEADAAGAQLERDTLRALLVQMEGMGLVSRQPALS